ncbi:MAG: peptide chain release factor N(5)-glutamine methyltransferase [Bacilli bacterium]|jgi:release factor glutamine methyltransferase|nr:peptide chain release factor N(5)-glutamine methyltransferase [Bacilli bacterium]
MTNQELVSFLYRNAIPLADIRLIMEGVFQVDFDRLGIIGSEGNIPQEKAKQLLQQLQDGYPAAYLAGYDVIRGLKIYLTPDVLIPRTETIDFLYGYLFTNFDLSHKKVLDLCTGSGVIALAIKNTFPSADVTASDISKMALALAKKSALLNHLDVRFVASDFLASVPGAFDVIVSNPPYIEEGAKGVVAKREPPLALYSGKDGLDSYRAIFKALGSHLNEKGLAFFELEANKGEAVSKLFLADYPQGYSLKVLPDMESKERYLQISKQTIV